VEVDMFCPECGAKVDPDSVFCTNCGAKIKELKPAHTIKKTMTSQFPKIGISFLILIVIVIFGYLLVSTETPEKKIVKRYFKALEEGDVEEVLNLSSSKVKEEMREVDPEELREFFQGIIKEFIAKGGIKEISIDKVNIKGIRAGIRTTILSSTGKSFTMVVPLVKENGEWKVELSFEDILSRWAVNANRRAIAADLANLGSKAQRYYRTPVEIGGGGNSFINFALSPLDTANHNGSYRVEIIAGGQAVVIHALGKEKIGNKYVAAIDCVTENVSRIYQGIATCLQTTDAVRGYGKLQDWTFYRSNPKK
jgi:predicted nucleic acid-binding Zn ribbon protein